MQSAKMIHGLIDILNPKNPQMLNSWDVASALPSLWDIPCKSVSFSAAWFSIRRL